MPDNGIELRELPELGAPDPRGVAGENPVEQNEKIKKIIQDFKTELTTQTAKLKNTSICEFINKIEKLTNQKLFKPLIEICSSQQSTSSGGRKSKKRRLRGGRKSKKRRSRGGRKSKKRLRGGRKSKKRII